MDRLLNYAFGFILIYLFVLFAGAQEHMQILYGLGAALLLSVFGFAISWLTLDGAQAAFVTGTTAFGLGGMPAAVIILSFFISGTLLTILNKPSQEDTYGDVSSIHYKRRNGAQVWANSFWFVFFMAIWFIFESEVWLIASIAALSTAMSDTWATEIGYRVDSGSTYVLKGWRKVQAGTDGGVSLAGTLGGFVGGMVMGILAFYLYPKISLTAGILIGLVGFVGNYFDSMLGAYFQYEGRSWSVPWESDHMISLENNGVNWVATGMGSFISLTLIYLFSIS